MLSRILADFPRNSCNSQFTIHNCEKFFKIFAFSLANGGLLFYY